jgi:anti-sigma regulatory factor (Ser/Thr protein kinase)
MQSDEPGFQDGREASGARLAGDGAGRPSCGRAPGGETLHVSLPLDADAPAAARAALAGLRSRVSPAVLSDAQLVVSELVTNSVLHSGAPATEFVQLYVDLTDTTVRLEVADPGRRDAIAPLDGDTTREGGFGLNLVRAVAEFWGLEQAAAGGTRVWAQLRLLAGQADGNSGQLWRAAPHELS